MDNLMDKTMAALERHVELLSKDGVSSGDREFSICAIEALTKLLHALSL